MFVETDARYGDPYAIDDDDDVAAEDALLLEDGDGVLASHTVVPRQLEGPLFFVDGVRRTDFRVHDVLSDGSVVRGLAGTYGVGAVACLPGCRPTFLPPTIERLLFWTHGHGAQLPEVDRWVWRAVGLATSDANELLKGLQRRMRAVEADVAGELITDGAIVVRDGPLNRLYDIDAEVVGLVKSHHKVYLPAEQHRAVPTVIPEPGQRTSLFRLREEAWGCYLRLPTRGRVGPWGGIVRIDVPASSVASTVADRACALIPRYASRPHVDPRAPANLQPIGAMEVRLRHLLGDVGGAVRAARAAAAQYDAQHVLAMTSGEDSQ